MKFFSSLFLDQHLWKMLLSPTTSGPERLGFFFVVAKVPGVYLYSQIKRNKKKKLFNFQNLFGNILKLRIGTLVKYS